MDEQVLTLEERESRLRTILLEMGSVAIGYSGGVDSTFLVAIAHQVLGNAALAVTARSGSIPQRELDEAVQMATDIGAPHLIIESRELENSDYANNPVNRCYFCKSELFARMSEVARERGLRWLAYGENYDDRLDHRPGSVAAQKWGVRAPLREAGLTKADIRELSRRLNLSIWDKPAYACLASRFPYGASITAEKLAQVEAAEDFLWNLGFRQFRVRHHGDIARLELNPAEMSTALGVRETIVGRLKELGFAFVSLDLQGYRMGSMNQGLRAPVVEPSDLHLAEV